MFERVVMLLLAGEFICKVSHPEEFRFLEREDERREIDRYLSRVGRRLAQTRHQSGYYLAFVRCGEQEKDTIRHHFAEIKSSLTPVVMFFQLVMRTTGQEELLMHGAIIESSAMMAAGMALVIFGAAIIATMVTRPTTMPCHFHIGSETSDSQKWISLGTPRNFGT